MVGRILAAVLVVSVMVCAVVAAWPQLFSLQSAPVVAQVVSLRGLCLAIALVAAVALSLIALTAPTARRLLGSIIAVLLAFSGVTGAVLLTRGFNSTNAPPDADSLTILEWNTLGSATGNAAVAELAIAEGADIVALPETRESDAREIARTMTASGMPMQVLAVAYDLVSAARTTSLLISDDLGDYQVDDAAGGTTVLPSVVARPVSGNGPTVIAVHAVSPIPGEMMNWRADLAWLHESCSGENIIMAGDFNATIDHFSGRGFAPGNSLADCADSAWQANAAAVGTWPTSIPSVLGAPIDHVLATRNWRTVAMHVVESLDGLGSDHRPIVVQLRSEG